MEERQRSWLDENAHYRETPKPRERCTSITEFNRSLHTRKPLDMVHHEGQVRCTIQVVKCDTGTLHPHIQVVAWDTEARYMWIRLELLDA